ncbi:MAG: CPBP family intramembrane metalloprotease [Phormidium sp. BM_Day4_Bin.17]|nr:CPBP family intramembrane metalloprotease [Phormidium sp. BM_Day4_Bin.17]UCJ14219.1 MAG: CPBP family intramembrane metalloprotease [Phormidium sp. PBR-2020]
MSQFLRVLQAGVGAFCRQFSPPRELGVEISPVLKIGLFFIVWLGIWLPILIPLAWHWRWYPSRPLTPSRKLALVGSLYLLFPLALWGLRRVAGVDFFYYGPRFPTADLSRLSLGIAIGIFGVMILMAVQKMAGWISWNLTWTVQDGVRQFLLALLLGIWIGGTEEFIFRGLVQQELQQQGSVWFAATITSGIFALLHLIWQPRQTLPQLPGLWLMGMVLTLACVATQGELSLAWGLHGGWVCAMIWLDSSQASQPTGAVPPWVTGLGEHPLAGILGILLLAATGAVLWFSNVPVVRLTGSV